MLEERYVKLIFVKPYSDEDAERSTAPFAIVDNKQQKHVKLIQDTNDEEGLKRAYETKDGLYQHYNKLLIAGTKDPIDVVDDLKLPFNDTLNKTTRGRTADKYYRSHYEVDTVIRHSLGGAVALSLENQYTTR